MLNDQLLERGVTIPSSLLDGYQHNTQTDWTFKDLKTVALDIDDGNDETSYTWIVEMMDGRWAAIRGWHDYTGWDCRSGLTTEWYKTKEDAFRTLVDWERDEVDKLNAVVAQR